MESRNMRSLTLSLFALFPTRNAIACPPGEWLQQGPGWQMCVPISGMSGSDSSQPKNSTSVWIDQWGAIAIDRVDGGVDLGSVAGVNSKKQAQKYALEACKRKGGTKCDIEIAYINQCSAIVWGDRALNSSTAATKEAAERRGIEKCSRSGDTNCEIYYSDCSPPRLAR